MHRDATAGSELVTEPRAFTVAKVAELLAISERHTRQLIADGHLRAVRIGVRGVRVSETELRRFLTREVCPP